MIENTQITAEDLNGVDALNGSPSVAAKGAVVNDAGESLKGALAKYNGTFSQREELVFIKNTLNDMYDSQIGLFKYEGLPEELDKNRIELKPFENGSAIFYKVNNKIVVVNYSQLDHNIYNEPTLVIINEPKSPLIHKKKIRVDEEGKDAAIFRNNWKMVSTYQKALRWIRNMERVLFQMEKNVTASAPKGIINLKNSEIEFNEPGETPIKSSMESMINGQDTFFALRNKGFNVQSDNEEDIFIPIELTDRAESLITQYTFFKEQLKETLGGEQNIHQKKERVQNSEMNHQQGLSLRIRRELLEVRQLDLERINNKFGTNITVELVEDETETEVPESEKQKGVE